MKPYISRCTWITTLAGLALSIVCLHQPLVYSQGMISVIVIFPSAGLAPGQSLRLTLFNPTDTTIQAQARLHHAGGVLVLMGDGSVRSGAFHSFDFKRSDIPLPGEDRTGRIQLLPFMTLSSAEPVTKIDQFAASLEIVEESTGRTDGTSNTIFFAERFARSGQDTLIGGSERDILLGGSSNDFLVGIVPGETLRITLSHQPTLGNTQRQTVEARVKIFDENGNLIAQSADLAIPPGDFRSVDFDHLALPMPGQPGTDRKQVRAHVEILHVSGFTPRASGPFVASMELIANSTGETTVHLGDASVRFLRAGIGLNSR